MKLSMRRSISLFMIVMMFLSLLGTPVGATDVQTDNVQAASLSEEALFTLSDNHIHIAITDQGFQPDRVSVFPGQNIHWTNETGQSQSVSAVNGLFDSGELSPGAGFSIALAVPGAHSYTSLHDEEFTGLIQVILSEIDGPSDALVSDHIPYISFPPLDGGDISVHPDLAVYASRTRIMVGFTPDATVAEANSALQQADVHILGGLPGIRMVLAGAPDSEDFAVLDGALNSLWADPAVEFAAMSMGVETQALPPRAESVLEENLGWKWTMTAPSVEEEPPPPKGNWGLEAASFPHAWNLLESIRRRGHTIITGVVDAGFEEHLDLPSSVMEVKNVLCLPYEPYSCIQLPNEPTSYHGNHVAGIIGADFDNTWQVGDEEGRSIGISGANPVARMQGFSMGGFADEWSPLLPSQIAFLADNLVELFYYIIRSAPPELRVINYSAGTTTIYTEEWLKKHPGQTPNNHAGWLQNFAQVGEAYARIAELAALKGIMIVQAAGNDGSQFCPSGLHDCDPFRIMAKNIMEFAWVSHYWDTERLQFTRGLPNPILIVESIGLDGNRFQNSNIGGDIAAPGERILSTASSHLEDQTWYPNEDWAAHTDSGYYVLEIGTSFAAPFVTAAIGYLLAYDPSLSLEDIRSALLTWAEPPEPGQIIAVEVEGGELVQVDAAPRLNAFASLLNLPDAIRHLVDINDMSRDGNRRVIRQFGSDPAEFSADTDFSTEEGFFSEPDGYVDIRDFRRFRDAWLQICAIRPDDIPGAPNRDHIDLDGQPDHPKKDLNFDGCVVPDNPDPEGDSCAPEHIGSRFDFNGSGFPCIETAVRVPLKADGTPAANQVEAVEMTDLELFWSQWSLDPLNLDNYGLNVHGLEDLRELMYSADLEIHGATLFEDGVDRVDVSVTNEVTGEAVFRSWIESTDDYRIATIPLGDANPASAEFTVRAWATNGEDAVEALPQRVTGLSYGEDRRIDMAGTQLILQATPDRLEADGASSALITARLEVNSGEEGDYVLEGLPVTFEINPEGPEHAYLDPQTADTDAAGEATTWFHAGTEEAAYTVTATVDLGDDREVSAEVLVSTRPMELRIHYIWQQENLEIWSAGTTSWPHLVTPETPDCSSPEVADDIYTCVDYTRLELDPEQPPSRLLRQGVIYGWEDEFYLDEVVSDDPVHFKQVWEVSAKDSSGSYAGTRTIAWQPQDPQQYQEYALPESVKADVTPEGITLHGLHELSMLDYLHNAVASGDGLPSVISTRYNLPWGNRFALYAQRFDASETIGAGTFFQHGGGFTQPITFRALEDGTYEPYLLCYTLEQDTGFLPCYMTQKVVGYANIDGIRRPVVGTSETYQPGDVPYPHNSGKIYLKFSLIIVPTFGDEEMALELPDCTEHVPPEADFSYEPAELAEGKWVQFLDASPHKLHPIVSWQWDFGDGTRSNQRSYFHRFQQSGTYDVSLTVTDSEGFTDTVTRAVAVANLPPTAKVDDLTVFEGEQIPITFEINDPGIEDREALQVHFQPDTPEMSHYHGTLPAGNYTLPYLGTVSPGQYGLTITVTDLDGATATDTATLTVIAQAEAQLLADFRFQPLEPEVGELVSFQDRSIGPHAIVSWQWDFGDGQVSSQQNPAHRFQAAAGYFVTLTVMDSEGYIASATREVSVYEPVPDPVTYSCGTFSAAECEFLHLLNAYRIANSLPAVTYSPALTVAARRHSQDMAEHEFVGHVGSDGSTLRERATDAGYPEMTVVGENTVRAITGSAEEAFELWLNSPGHNENMLHAPWRAAGISRVQGEDGYWYWTNKFGDLLDVPAEGTGALESYTFQQTDEQVSTNDLMAPAIYQETAELGAGSLSTCTSYCLDGADAVNGSGTDGSGTTENEMVQQSCEETHDYGTAVLEVQESYLNWDGNGGYPPVPALLVHPACPEPGSPVTFVNRSRDFLGTPLAALLDPGDGSSPVALEPGQSHMHTYDGSGDFLVSLSATDSQLRSLDVSRLLQVKTGYTLSVDMEGQGSVEIDGIAAVLPYSAGYPAGTLVELEAVSAAGWAFQKWVIGGQEVDDTTTTVTMDGHKSVTAVFQATGTGSINHVVLEIDAVMVIFTIGAYGSALAAGPGDGLYDYMASGGVPVVRAVCSGDKFIGIGAYGTAYAQEGNTADAIAAAPPQDHETISAYLIFEGFDGEGEPILTPRFP